MLYGRMVRESSAANGQVFRANRLFGLSALCVGHKWERTDENESIKVLSYAMIGHVPRGSLLSKAKLGE